MKPKRWIFVVSSGENESLFSGIGAFEKALELL